MNSDSFETAMVYISDHGESLGENGIYLHDIPNFTAPENLHKVAAIFWFGASYTDIDKIALTDLRLVLLIHHPKFRWNVGWWLLLFVFILKLIPLLGKPMQITLYIDDKEQTLELSDENLKQGEDFFKMMDRDMDKGWQMSREWVDCPNLIQRCQIAADRMLSAIGTENETLLMLLAGYIVSRAPDVRGVRIDTNGEMMETELLTQ